MAPISRIDPSITWPFFPTSSVFSVAPCRASFLPVLAEDESGPPCPALAYAAPSSPVLSRPCKVGGARRGLRACVCVCERGAFRGTMEAVCFASVTGPAAWKIFSRGNLARAPSPPPSSLRTPGSPSFDHPIPRTSAWRGALKQQALGRALAAARRALAAKCLKAPSVIKCRYRGSKRPKRNTVHFRAWACCRWALGAASAECKQRDGACARSAWPDRHGTNVPFTVTVLILVQTGKGVEGGGSDW